MPPIIDLDDHHGTMCNAKDSKADPKHLIEPHHFRIRADSECFYRSRVLVDVPCRQVTHSGYDDKDEV